MRPPAPRRTPPDPLARSLDAHAAAEGQRREAERTVAILRERMGRARVAALEQRRRAAAALGRGEEATGLRFLDAADAACAEVRRAAIGLAPAARRARQLASVERFRRAELFREIARFLAAAEARP